MKNKNKVKINYNIYAEEKNGVHQAIIARIIKKSLMERRDNYICLSKKKQTLDAFYFEIINNFISENLNEIKDEIVSLNIITPISEGLELLKSKYKKVDPYEAKPLKGNEEVYLEVKQAFQVYRERGIQVQFVPIYKDERNKELNEISYRLNNKKYLNNHFFSITTENKKNKLLRNTDNLILKDDNSSLELYIRIKKIEGNNNYEFCCTTIKRNKYDQPKNHYYTLKMNNMEEQDAFIEGIARFYTQNKSAMKLLNGCNILNIYHDGNYLNKSKELFANLLNKESEINLYTSIPELINKKMDNYIQKNNYRLENKENKKKIAYKDLENKKDTMIIYTDGSVINKSELSTYGAVFRMPNSDYIIYEITGNTDDLETKNQIDFIENKGIYTALNFINEKFKNKELKRNFNIEIRCDSYNNIREINKKIDGISNIKNKSWEEKINGVVNLAKNMGVNVEFNWVKGHYLDPYNERADKLARMGYLADKNTFHIKHKDEELEDLINKKTLKKERKLKI